MCANRNNAMGDMCLYVDTPFSPTKNYMCLLLSAPPYKLYKLLFFKPPYKFEPIT